MVNIKGVPTTIQKTDKLTNMVVNIAVVVSVILCIYFGLQWKSNLSAIENKAISLNVLTNYDTNTIAKAKETKKFFPNWKTLEDIVDTNQDLNLEKDRYSLYFQNLQAPYTNFFSYLLLPSLNIWKNFYTQNIDITLIGQKYLEHNPYTKLSLIEKWSSFFREVGDTSQFNKITDITVNDIQSDGKFFRIPITLSFTSPNKRSFLLLVEKLSMTSSKDNIALMNEFLYNLFESIKDKKKEVLNNKVFPGAMSGAKTADRKIGYLLYNWIKTNDDQNIVDDSIIDEAIQKSAGCATAGTEKCYYLFRDKYRTLPYFAYTIADQGTSKTNALKVFLQNLPPIMQIKEFTFNQSRVAQIAQAGNAYEGKISIELIGRDISDVEVKEIANVLGNTCFQDKKKPMGIKNALDAVEAYIVQLSHLTAENVTKGQELSDLKVLLEEMRDGYDKLSNFDKVVKMFEMYRMLFDSSVCKL